MLSLMLIAGTCGTGCSRKEETGAGYLFTCTLAGNPECLDPQYTDNENAEIVICNIMEGLLRLDETGTVIPAGAESYTVSEDGLVYTFRLRDNCYWYSVGTEAKDAKPVTSLDYVFAFRRLLAPETHAPHAEDFLCIENAPEIRSGKLKPEKLSVSAPDGATVIFRLTSPEPDFPMLLTQSCAVPCNEDFFLSTQGRYGLSDSTILCNGAFCLTKWAYDAYGSGNFLSFRKNMTYHDADAVFPGSLQFNIMRSQQEANQDFAAGNSDMILTDRLPEQGLNNTVIKENYTRTWGLIFNPDDDTLKNITFRKALSGGIDRQALQNFINDNLTPAYGVIPPAIQFLGRSYRELYADEPLSPYDPVQSAILFDEVLPEIPASVITSMKILVPAEFTDTQALLSICQEWQNLSGHYIGIESVSVSEYRQRLEKGDYTIALYCAAPSQDSCYAALQMFQEDVFAFHSTEFEAILKNLSDAGTLADKIPLCGEAEKMIIENGIFLPLFYQCSYLIYTDTNTDIICHPFRNVIDFRSAKHFS